ncbi:hypothetical protein XENTR_v10003778 [Xenopus tropicalis]|uniref:Uncharacterized protein LOC100490013 n=1 Tax=Xenopus tropicalis TaxID=8364 RepID=A0A8J0SC49_XENTR|nr:uncharacterized protein LOC100490013 [Xenopus tropicalis]KAE8575243.1 hypothetical protein XENTR_v10003778 [Xenopus tropicalis]
MPETKMGLWGCVYFFMVVAATKTSTFSRRRSPQNHQWKLTGLRNPYLNGFTQPDIRDDSDIEIMEEREVFTEIFKYRVRNQDRYKGERGLREEEGLFNGKHEHTCYIFPKPKAPELHNKRVGGIMIKQSKPINIGQRSYAFNFLTHRQMPDTMLISKEFKMSNHNARRTYRFSKNIQKNRHHNILNKVFRPSNNIPRMAGSKIDSSPKRIPDRYRMIASKNARSTKDHLRKTIPLSHRYHQQTAKEDNILNKKVASKKHGPVKPHSFSDAKQEKKVQVLTEGNGGEIPRRVTLTNKTSKISNPFYGTETNKQLALHMKDNRAKPPLKEISSQKNKYLKKELGGIFNDRGGQQKGLPSEILLETEGSGHLEVRSKGNQDFSRILNITSETESSTVSPSPLISLVEQRQGTSSVMQFITSTHKSMIINTIPFPAFRKDESHSMLTGPTTSKGLPEQVASTFPDSLRQGGNECDSGYKKYGDRCKSLCEINGIYCENGGQCVILENIGAVCRCPETELLCYRDHCCVSSLTPIQLVCIIGSCCVLLSALLVCVPVLILRTQMKMFTKTGLENSRFWIPTLMPASSISFSSIPESVESEFTVDSDCDSLPDFPSFFSTKKVTSDTSPWTSESTKL